MANGCPGGPASEGFISCIQIASFLSSPEHRITLMAEKSILKIHQGWLAFYNSKSELHFEGRKSDVISNRILESSIFEVHHILNSICAMRYDFLNNFPDLSNYVVSELERAFELGLLDENKGETIHSCRSRWSELFQLAAESMYQVTIKDFVDNRLKLAWSLSYLVNPRIAPIIASAYLVGYNQLHLININIDNVPSIIDSYGPFPAYWSAFSSTHPFPGISNLELFNLVVQSITRANYNSAFAIFNAYGLQNLVMQEELHDLACGALQNILDVSNNFPYWYPGAALESYYQSCFVQNFPAISSLFFEKFINVSTATTVLEATYSNSHLKKMNSSTENLSMHFGHLINNQQAVIKGNTTNSHERKNNIDKYVNKQYRPQRSNDSIHAIANDLATMGNEMDKNTKPALKYNVDLVIGKYNKDLVVNIIIDF